MIRDTRGKVQAVDVLLSLLVFVSFVVTASFQYKFLGMASAQADAFTSLLLQLIPLVIVFGLILSMGVSARSG